MKFLLILVIKSKGYISVFIGLNASETSDTVDYSLLETTLNLSSPSLDTLFQFLVAGPPLVFKEL